MKDEKKMEEEQNNYFSSTQNFKIIIAPPPTSLPDLETYFTPLSGREVIIYKDEADTAPVASQFPKLFFEKNEATGAVFTSSL